MAEQHSQTGDYNNRWKFTGHELAVFMKNRARKIENKDAKLRITYGRNPIDLKLLKNPPNLKCFEE